MQCDLCGKSTDLVNAVVEGSMLSVCKNCAKFGNVVEVKKPTVYKQVFEVQKEQVFDEIVEGYGEKIKKARTEKNLTQDDLAKKIAVKESVIRKIETEEIKPDLVTAKKLENFLKVKLIEQYREEKKELNLKDKSLTIGDLLKLKGK